MFQIALLSASQPLLLFTSFTYVLASTADLHMSQLTHCLPTIICVTLIYIVYVLLKQLLYTFFICIIICPLCIISVNIFCHLVSPVYSVLG